MWTLQGLGKLKGLTNLNTGLGLDVRPTLVVFTDKEDEDSIFDLEPSLDAFYRLTPSLTTTMTRQTLQKRMLMKASQYHAVPFILPSVLFLEDADKLRLEEFIEALCHFIREPLD